MLPREIACTLRYALEAGCAKWLDGEIDDKVAEQYSRRGDVDQAAPYSNRDSHAIAVTESRRRMKLRVACCLVVILFVSPVPIFFLFLFVAFLQIHMFPVIVMFPLAVIDNLAVYQVMVVIIRIVVVSGVNRASGGEAGDR